ncbi:UNVERIFIED_CONTAM: Protein of unknown function (DUF2953) [Acetivibrio alkalicellulosi]
MAKGGVIILRFFIAVLIIFISVILITKINIIIEYKKKNKDDIFVLSIFLYKGLIKYKYEIPKVDPKKQGVLLRLKKEKGHKEKDTRNSKEYFNYSTIMERIKSIKNLYSKHKKLLKEIRNYLKCKLKIKSLDFNLVIGTGDASHTSILIGLAWTFSGIIISTLYRFININEKNINIKPDYVGKNINIDLYCILSLRIVHIIVIGFMILKHFIKNRFLSGLTKLTMPVLFRRNRPSGKT